LKIDSVGFVMSAGSAQECPPGSQVEIAVSGRSNVGKSSLLNSLFGRKDLVKVSSTPGKTQRLNYLLVNERFHVVDLPGYGFAKAPASLRDRWRRMMQGYLRTRRQLVAIIQLVDSRHVPSREDREMVQWLRDEQLPFCLVATKMDKLRQGERQAALRAIAGALELPGTQPLVPYSSHTGEGRDALLAWIGQALDAASET
jgi:GTP-binding protein